MISSKAKRKLFGGALRCAGVAAAAATLTSTVGADFEPLAPTPVYPNFIQGVAFGSGGYEQHLHYSYDAAFPEPVSVTGSGLEFAGYSSSTVMGVNLVLEDSLQWSIAYVRNHQYFTMAHAAKSVLFEWDLTPVTDGFAHVYEVGVGVVSTEAQDGTSGSEMLTLNAGSTYAFVGFVLMTDQEEGGGFARITWVPAPGALGLLGVGALTARKRRRQ